MINEIVEFVNGPVLSPLSHPYKCSIFGGHLHDVNLEKLSEIILEKEKEITSMNLPSELENDAYTGLPKTALTSRFKAFNVLSWEHEEILKLKKQIRLFYNRSCDYFQIDKNEKVFIQCWANVLRKGEKMNIHTHTDDTNESFLSGNITVKCYKTNTVYQNPFSYNSPETYFFFNYPGKIHIFNSYIPHYTTEHNSDSERITIAFDFFYRKHPDIGKFVEL